MCEPSTVQLILFLSLNKDCARCWKAADGMSSKHKLSQTKANTNKRRDLLWCYCLALPSELLRSTALHILYKILYTDQSKHYNHQSMEWITLMILLQYLVFWGNLSPCIYVEATLTCITTWWLLPWGCSFHPGAICSPDKLHICPQSSL